MSVVGHGIRLLLTRRIHLGFYFLHIQAYVWLQFVQTISDPFSLAFYWTVLLTRRVRTDSKSIEGLYHVIQEEPGFSFICSPADK